MAGEGRKERRGDQSTRKSRAWRRKESLKRGVEERKRKKSIKKEEMRGKVSRGYLNTKEDGS